MDTIQLKRIADAIEEILRLVKKDMEKMEKITKDDDSGDETIEAQQKKEIEKYGDVNQGLGTWNGYEYVKKSNE